MKRFNAPPLSRREALKQTGTAGAAALLVRGVLRGQDGEIVVAGKPVEVVVSELGPAAVKLTLLPLENGRPDGRF